MNIKTAILAIKNITWPAEATLNSLKKLPSNIVYHITEDDEWSEEDAYIGVSDGLYLKYGFIPEDFDLEYSNVVY